MSVEIKKNTVDISAHIYSSAHQCEYRWHVGCDPDFPEAVVLSYQELIPGNNPIRTDYETKGSISFTKEDWAKIRHGVDTVFEKSI